MRFCNIIPLFLFLATTIAATAPADQHRLGSGDEQHAPACWPGKEIHDPCDGFETGCTVDGILVTCDGDPQTGDMIFLNGCPISGSPFGGCVCTDGAAYCNGTDDSLKDPECWPGKQIHDPCDGFGTGCTAGGILVACDGNPATGHMIFSNDCAFNGSIQGGCVCTDGDPQCRQSEDIPGKCWPGKEIHDPCDGYESGCTVDGILVVCDGNLTTGSMIFSNDCAFNGSIQGGCVCTDGDPQCRQSEDIPGKCWPGKEIHDPCDGYESGCTVDGIMVMCDGDPKTGAMIVDEDCPTTATCVCVGGIAKCEEDKDKHFLGGEL